MEHQDVVDKLVMLKAVRDYVDDAYEEARKAYTRGELERTRMPRGDESPYGTIQANFSKPSDDEIVREFVVTDSQALLDDTSEDFKEWVEKEWWPTVAAQAAEAYFNEVGELLDGCELMETLVEGSPKTFRYFKVVPTKQAKEHVAELLAPIAGLIGGSDER